MPIYEYKCSECGNVYEKRQKFSDPADTTCNCEKQAPVFRVTSAPALVFKGSGWYINDYARAGKDGAAKENGTSKETKQVAASKENGATSGASRGTDSGSSAKSDSGVTTTASSPAPASTAKP